jgi:hypothetical protein
MIRPLRRGLPRLAACAAAVLIAAAVAACGGAARRAPQRATTSETATTATTPGTASIGSTTTAQTTGSAPVTYGIGDSQGKFAGCIPSDAFCCDPATAHCDMTGLYGYFNSPTFLKLTSAASAHRISEVRMFVSYDAVMQWNGSTASPGCEYSQVVQSPWTDPGGGSHPAAESISDLIAGLIEAHANGLTPVVSIAGYATLSVKPPWDAPAPDPTTLGGYWGYRCGVEGILDALSRLPQSVQPHIWEALNEPDALAIFRDARGPQARSCQVAATPQPDGAAKAACDEVIASRVIHGFAGHGGDTVLAGTFERPDVSYLNAYAAQIAREMPGAAFPRTWSVHDYVDVDHAYGGLSSTELRGFDEALKRDTDSRATSLWITEAGTVLTSHTRTGACPAIGVAAAGTLGACLNGQPVRQQATAAAFFALPTVADAVPITHLFWYQFESAPNWDSGLIDATGQPRAAYCAFYGSGSCTGNPYAPVPPPA